MLGPRDEAQFQPEGSINSPDYYVNLATYVSSMNRHETLVPLAALFKLFIPCWSHLQIVFPNPRRPDAQVLTSF